MKLNHSLVLIVCFVSLLLGTTVIADVPTIPVPQQIPEKNSPTSFSLRQVQRFGVALQIIKNSYVEPIPDQKLFDNAIRGVLGGLDPHSAFLDAEDLQELNDITSGEFSGLGIEITPDNGYIRVISPLDGSPAQKAGIKSGDLILRIDNMVVKDMTVQEAVKKMRGKKGTAVMLTIARKGETKPLKLELVRDDIHVQSVTSRLLEQYYGYVRISSFQVSTDEALKKAINSLKEQSNGKLKGLILDLRNDPGGLLDSAVDVADDFLDSTRMGMNKMIVYAKGRLADSQLTITATPGDIINGLPMVVLINGGSASASEIVAGALQDHKRAIIMGTNSFGKGSVQTVIPLDSTSALKLTTALYYTPFGRSIQAAGIQPDVVVNDLKVTAANDKSLIESIKEADLRGHLANGNTPSTPSSNPDKSVGDKEATQMELPASELAFSDYQLFEALNLLKGMVVAQATTF